MVAKISVGSSLFGALSYNQNKVDEEQGKVLLSNRMFESEDGNFSIRRCMECFDMHLPADLKTEKPIIHISLNPHPDDVLSDSQLADIAKEYMDKLGYGNQPYMVYKHEDIARHHIHIVSIRVDDTGKKINDKFEHIRSKQITRELEQKYGLHPAEKKHFCCRMTGHGRYILMICMQEPNQSVRFIRTWNCRRLAVWFLGLMSCLVDVTGFVFGVHNLLAPVQTKVSGEHIAESDSQKKIWHAVITEQFKTD